MEYMGFRPGYVPNYDGQGYGQQAQGVHGYPYGVSYEQQQMVLAQLQHQQRTAAMMGCGGMPGKPIETKPRLAKEEVELLEREFQKNPKPNSSLKRDLADQMRVDVARINNWFQNRRAKAKQMKKTAEYEAQQAAERAASGEQSTDDSDNASGDFYDLNNNDDSLDHEPLTASDDEDEEERAINFAPVPPMPALDASSSSPLSVKHEPSSDGSIGMPIIDSHLTALPVQVTPPNFPQQLPQAIVNVSQPMPHHAVPMAPLHTFDLPIGGPSLRDEFSTPITQEYVNNMALSMPTFPSQLLPLHTRFADTIKADASVNELPLASPSPVQQQQQFTTPELPRRPSPPRMDLATRRNLRRPAQLTPSAMRSCSFGPKTGTDGPCRSESATPMRRIASATGPLHGRIQKQNLGMPPRSPMFSERGRGALLQQLQGRLSPPTPSDAMTFTSMSNTGLKDDTASSISDEDQRYRLEPSYFTLDPTSMKTPPGTPGIQVQFSNSIDLAWSSLPGEEPLITPSLGSFGSEIDFPQSTHVPSAYAVSQPPTPSFPPQMSAPTFYPVFGGNGLTLECKFPDSFPQEPVVSSVGGSARSSPVPSASGAAAVAKSFQFAQNVTPQDYGHQGASQL